MSEKIVVVAGPPLAAAVGFPILAGLGDLITNDAHLAQVLSPKEYGNFLPEFWTFVKQHALAALPITPSPLHLLLAERQWPIITLNVGGVHLQAGSTTVVEVHGQLFKARCLRCHHEQPMTPAAYAALQPGEVPACQACGKERTRPDIVLPGENLKHKRVADNLIEEATRTIFLGVQEETPTLCRWRERGGTTLLVHEEPWGSFDRHLAMSPQEWGAQGGDPYS